MLNFQQDGNEQPEASSSPISPVSLVTSTEDELHLFKTVLDSAPINIMIADAQSMEITYVNESGRQTLKALEDFLPIKADALIGAHADIFHVNPSHQRRLLANPESLPHRAVIQVGDEHLDLLVSAANDQSSATEEISRNVQETATSTHEVTENITSVTQTAQETENLSGQVLGAVEELRKLAAGAGEQTKAFFEKMDRS